MLQAIREVYEATLGRAWDFPEIESRGRPSMNVSNEFLEDLEPAFLITTRIDDADPGLLIELNQPIHFIANSVEDAVDILTDVIDTAGGFPAPVTGAQVCIVSGPKWDIVVRDDSPGSGIPLGPATEITMSAFEASTWNERQQDQVALSLAATALLAGGRQS